MLKQLFVILFLGSSSYTFSQSYFYDSKYYDADLLWEAGASFGLMNSLSDVGARKGNGLSPGYYDWKSSKSNWSVYAGILFKSTVEGRLEYTKGGVAGNDANSNSTYVKSRNLSFKSKITELSLTGTFHPLVLLNAEKLPIISPYLLAGAGVFSFNPETVYNGETIALQPLNTEGQASSAYPAREAYSLKGISLQLGLGLKYEFNAKINIRVEGVYRSTSTDYLDDASTTYVDRSVFTTDLQKILSHRYTELNPQWDNTGMSRGNTNNKDGFFTINLKIGYVVGRQKIPINYNPTK